MATCSGALREGLLFRQDTLAQNVVHHRVGRLYADRLDLFHVKHREDGSALPEFSIPLRPELQLSHVRVKTYDVKPPGTNLFKGYITGQMHEQQLFTFKLLNISSDRPLRPSRGTLGNMHADNLLSKLTIGCSDREEAESWQRGLKQCLYAGNASESTESVGREGDKNDSHRQGPVEASPESSTKLGDQNLKADFRNAPFDSEANDEDSAVLGPPVLADDVRALLPSRAPLATSVLWSSVFFWNGLVCYREPSSRPAYAAACSVRATPLHVFQYFVRLADGTSGWDVFKDIQVLESTPDDESDLVFKATLLKPGGLLGAALKLGLVAPREVVLQQTWWLRDGDGVFEIAYRSVDHPMAPKVPRGWATPWSAPVRAHVRHIGLTISPMNEGAWQSEGKSPLESPETMVTLVVRATLGGAIPYLRLLGFRWLADFMSTMAQMRSALEQLRFVEPAQAILCGQDLQPALSTKERRQIAVERGVSIVRGAPVDLSTTELPGEEEWLEVAQGAPARAGSGATDTAPAASGRGGDEPQSWLPAKYYCSPPGAGFKVRGPNYLNDKKKVTSADPAFALKGVELVTTERADVLHICPYLPLVMHSSDPFHVPIHFKMPYGGKNLHLVCVFSTRTLPVDTDIAESPFTNALGTFYAADANQRNAMLKLIPQIVEGSWVVRQAVGSTPFIIGKKLSTTYYRTSKYLEVTVDIQSNSTAASITGYVAGVLKSMSISLGFVLEGQIDDHLPEQLLGTVSLNQLDLSEARSLDVSQPLDPRNVAPSETPVAVDVAGQEDMMRHRAAYVLSG